MSPSSLLLSIWPTVLALLSLLKLMVIWLMLTSLVLGTLLAVMLISRLYVSGGQE